VNLHCEISVLIIMLIRGLVFIFYRGFLPISCFLRGAYGIHALWVNLYYVVVILITIVLVRGLDFIFYRGFFPNASFFRGAH
jgi:hypothetical protein